MGRLKQMWRCLRNYSFFYLALEIYKTCTLDGDSEYFHPTGERILPSKNVTALFQQSVILIGTVQDISAKIVHLF